MRPRYEQRSDPYRRPPPRDEKYAPPSRSRPEYATRDSRYAPYPSHHPPAEFNGYRDSNRRYSPPARTSSRYYEEPRHAERGPPQRAYTPPSAHHSSSRRYNDQYPARDEYSPRQSHYSSRRDTLPQQSFPSSRDHPRDYQPPARSYNQPPRRDPATKPPPREMSPVRGDLLPTTMKFMRQHDKESEPSSRYERRAPPPRDDYPDRSRPSASSYRRDEAPRSRLPPRNGYDDDSRRRPASRPFRGRGGATRGKRPAKYDVSPIRTSENEGQQNGDSPQKRRHPSTPPQSRSRTITPPEKIQADELKRNGHHKKAIEENEDIEDDQLEFEDDQLEFEDEIDPAVVEKETKSQRKWIQPPNVEDLKLMDVTEGVEMAEINERASTSVDCPLSPSSTVSEEIRYLSGDSFDKIAAYVQGQVDTSVDDYKILEEMNKTTAQRYKDMHQVAETISTRLKNLGDKYQSLRPQLDQIDQIDEVSKRLENTVGVLEKYFNALEGKFKQVQSSPTRSQN
ncbi:hypothetical protein M3Y97_00707600 [Aphelenchoides bicaudatus]|nr:hypothetical protein M3Y97_00707600 [Aphelenchoides bicaudatus]